MSSLSDPGLPAIIELLEDELTGTIAMATQYVEGVSLATVRCPVAPTTLLEFGGEIARILAVVHAKGIVHRDLKPANDADEDRGAEPERELEDLFGCTCAVEVADVDEHGPVGGHGEWSRQDGWGMVAFVGWQPP